MLLAAPFYITTSRDTPSIPKASLVWNLCSRRNVCDRRQHKAIFDFKALYALFAFPFIIDFPIFLDIVMLFDTFSKENLNSV